MKKKIAILLSAMMVASAMPMTASAVEYGGAELTNNAGFPKTDSTIDPAAENSSSIYGASAGETSFDKDDLLDRLSSIQLKWANIDTSGNITGPTRYKLQLENGTFDDDLLSKYKYVNILTTNGTDRIINYDDTFITPGAGETLTDYYIKLIKAEQRRINNENNVHYYGWVSNAEVYAADGKTLNSSDNAVMTRNLADVSSSDADKNIVGAIKKVQELVNEAKTNGSATFTANNGSGGTETITLTIVAEDKIKLAKSGGGTVSLGSSSDVNFDGSSSTDTEAAFINLVEYVSGTAPTSTSGSSASLSANLFGATGVKLGNNTTAVKLDDQIKSDIQIPDEIYLQTGHLPYKFEIDDEKTATVTIPYGITNDEVNGKIQALGTMTTSTSAHTLLSNGTTMTGSTFTTENISKMDTITVTETATITQGQANAGAATNFPKPNLVLPLGAVVADSQAPVKVTVNGDYSEKTQTTKDFLITKSDVAGSTSLVYPDSNVKRFDEDIVLSPVVLRENARGTIGKQIANGQTDASVTTDIFVRLTGNFKFDMSEDQINANISNYIKDDSGNISNWNQLIQEGKVTAQMINDSTIKFSITGLQNKETRKNTIGFRFENLKVKPTNKTVYGEVNFNVSGDGITSQSILVARREELGFKLTTTTDPKDIYNGRHYVANNYAITSGTNGAYIPNDDKASGTMLEQDNTTVEIKFQESIPNTLIASRTLNFDVPEGVKIVDAEVYDYKGFKTEPTEQSFRVTNGGKTLELIRNTYTPDTEKISEFKMKLDLSIDPSFTGDVKLAVSGGGQEEKVEAKIANAKNPFTVETSTTKANMGYQEYSTSNITITENIAGMFLENRDVVLSLVAPYGTGELGFSNATIKTNDNTELKIKDNSFKVGKYDGKEGTISFRVERASHKNPASVTLENVKVGTTRSVPYGSYALSLSGGAVINNYTGNVKESDDYTLNYITGQNDKKVPNLVMQDSNSYYKLDNYIDIITETGTFDDIVKVSIGEKTVLIGDKAVDMDVAPYIQASSNSTMVPLRFVSVALGVDSTSVDNPDASNKIAWDANTKTTTIYYGEGTGQKIIQFQAGSNIMTVDGTRIPMEYGVKAEIKDGRMFVPFRALGQALGINVKWDPDTRTAIYNADKVANTSAAPTTATETTTETTTASDTTTESTTASDSTTESTTAKQ